MLFAANEWLPHLRLQRALLYARKKHVSCVSWRACHAMLYRHARHSTSQLFLCQNAWPSVSRRDEPM